MGLLPAPRPLEEREIRPGRPTGRLAVPELWLLRLQILLFAGIFALPELWRELILAMKTFLYAYLGGLLASIPAYVMFSNVGASPFRNFDAVMSKIGGSITSIVVYFLLILIVPALGSAIGAKLGGRGAEFHYIYGRGIGGQFIFAILFSLLIMFVPQVGGPVTGFPTSMQTVAFLAFAQVGCTFGTVWGY